MKASPLPMAELLWEQHTASSDSSESSPSQGQDEVGKPAKTGTCETKTALKD